MAIETSLQTPGNRRRFADLLPAVTGVVAGVALALLIAFVGAGAVAGVWP